MQFLVLLSLVTGAALAQTAGRADFFQQKIRPLVMARCQGCHNNALKFGGFSMDSAANWRAGGSFKLFVTAGLLTDP